MTVQKRGWFCLNDALIGGQTWFLLSFRRFLVSRRISVWNRKWLRLTEGRCFILTAGLVSCWHCPDLSFTWGDETPRWILVINVNQPLHTVCYRIKCWTDVRCILSPVHLMIHIFIRALSLEVFTVILTWSLPFCASFQDKQSWVWDLYQLTEGG